MEKAEAQELAPQLGREHPERTKYRWLAREQADGDWTVVKVALPSSGPLTPGRDPAQAAVRRLDATLGVDGAAALHLRRVIAEGLLRVGHRLPADPPCHCAPSRRARAEPRPWLRWRGPCRSGGRPRSVCRRAQRRARVPRESRRCSRSSRERSARSCRDRDGCRHRGWAQARATRYPRPAARGRPTGLRG